MWPFKRKLPEAEHIWKIWEHTNWGDAIHLDSWEKYPKMHGHIINPRVSLGDIIVTQLTCGGLAWLKVIELEYKHDPNDMFFGKLKVIGEGYVSEEEVEQKVKELAPNMQVTGWLI